MEAILALEDGTVFHGHAAGAEGETRGEVVFNTSMTGYQEVLTDPSYSGQIVTMTCPRDRQLRRVARRRRVARAAGGRLHHPRRVAGGEQLARGRHAARLPRRQRHRRDLRHRHARADAAAAVGRRDARRHRAPATRLDPAALVERARVDSADGRVRPRPRRHRRDAPFDWPPEDPGRVRRRRRSAARSGRCRSPPTTSA